MTPLQTAMQNNGLIIDFTDTTALTNKQRVSLDLANFAVLKQLFFKNGFNLNQERITGIAIDVSNYTLTKDPTNLKTVPSYDDISRGTLFLFDSANRNVITLPLTDLVLQTNGGKVLRLDFKNLNIGASYVIFSSAGSITTSYSLPFTFFYK